MATFVDDMSPLENENNVLDSEEDKLETASESSDEIYDLVSDSGVKIYPDPFVGNCGTEWTLSHVLKIELLPVILLEEASIK